MKETVSGREIYMRRKRGRVRETGRAAGRFCQGPPYQKAVPRERVRGRKAAVGVGGDGYKADLSDLPGVEKGKRRRDGRAMK
ncbi:hypothetical protein NL676_008554 [Syzygium grande]|nr:hypothetical protein NL676_008554 [Syzygium grande]